MYRGYHFTKKEISKELERQLERLGGNTKKDITFSMLITKEIRNKTGKKGNY